MKPTRLNLRSGVLMGTAAVVLLFPIALTPGCGQPKAATRTDEVKQFLAPTDVSKLRPEAREALSHMPGGDKFQPSGSVGGAPK